MENIKEFKDFLDAKLKDTDVATYENKRHKIILYDDNSLYLEDSHFGIVSLSPELVSWLRKTLNEHVSREA